MAVKNAIQKWGNSLGLRIPTAIASELHIKRGTPVTLQVENDALTVRVAKPQRRRHSKYKLRELVARITPENFEPTYEWGRDMGKEAL